MARMTNEEFGRRVGIHYSYASRLVHGERMPSGELFFRIVREFDLDLNEASEAFEGGPSVFGRYLSDKVTEPPEKTNQA